MKENIQYTYKDMDFEGFVYRDLVSIDTRDLAWYISNESYNKKELDLSQAIDKSQFLVSGNICRLFNILPLIFDNVIGKK